MTAQLSREQIKTRIEKALKDFTDGRAAMHVPPLDTDVDMVLSDCLTLLAGMDSEPVAFIVKSPLGNVAYRTITAEDAEYIKRKGYTCEPLYAAPPALVVPDMVGWIRADYENDGRKGDGPLFVRGKNDPSIAWGIDYVPVGVCRAAPPAPVAVPDGYALVPLKPTKDMLIAADDERGADWQYAVDIWDSMCRAAMLAPGVMYDPRTATTGSATMQSFGNSEQLVSPRYKLPAGWKLVPVEPTESMVIDGFESEPDETFSEPEAWEAYQAMSGCQQAAHRARLCYAAMLEAAPAAPEQEV